MSNSYIERYAYFDQQVFSPIEDKLNMVIVIPSRREAELLKTLESLHYASNAKLPYEILIVFNHPQNENADLKKENFRLLKECKEWIEKKALVNIHIIKAFDLPDKHAGVGLARKIGMDEAVRRLGLNNKGIIVSLDADCIVKKNYLQAIENKFDAFPDCNGASIYYEHQINDLDKGLAEGIIQYELHLRYYLQLLKYASHPYAFQTVGSCMAVRSEVYQLQGGMNKRKAGEDFYFLQKIIQLGHFGEINDTCIYHSARVSDRVPFGTGKAQNDWQNKSSDRLTTYHPQAGEDLKSFLSIVKKKSDPDFSQLPESIGKFIGVKLWIDKMSELKNNTRSKEAFTQRFFQWFNLFMCFKYVHFYRDNFRANIDITEAASTLYSKIVGDLRGGESTFEVLQKFRELEQ